MTERGSHVRRDDGDLLTDRFGDGGSGGDERELEDWEDPRPRTPKTEKEPGFFRRHKAFTVMLVIFALIIALIIALGWYLNRQIDKIPRVPLKISGPRPPVGSGLNILLAGADNGDDKGPTIAESVAAGAWKPGSHRSDTIMLLHITADRKKAYIVSVPRDTYVKVDGYGMQKINAAFSLGGPSLYVKTLEQFTQVRMNHLAIIDWNGFRDLSTALGGVRVFVAEDSYDSASGLSWKKGWQSVEGDRALRYVRQRHGLPNGDFDRIRRQQNFLRQALTQAADKGNLTNPLRFNAMLRAITRNLTLDSGFTNGELRDLAFSLRGLRARDITFIQLPFARFETHDVGSTVIPKEAQTRELFSALSTDDMGDYLQKYGAKDVLGGPTDVN